jgi:hypothetical protein
MLVLNTNALADCDVEVARGTNGWMMELGRHPGFRNRCEIIVACGFDSHSGHSIDN